MDVRHFYPSIFLSTPSARRATAKQPKTQQETSNFYPRPPRGGRPEHIARLADLKEFLSTPSARRATATRREHVRENPDFYPRPPRGGRPETIHADRKTREISIHALREEGDDDVIFLTLTYDDISIHALREEGDGLQTDIMDGIKISIHALREEGDVIDGLMFWFVKLFLSTPSARRATFVPNRLLWEHFEFLSTPSARRATGLYEFEVDKNDYFYPRPPRGGRHGRRYPG